MLYISDKNNNTKMYVFMAPLPRRKVNYGSNKCFVSLFETKKCSFTHFIPLRERMKPKSMTFAENW